MEIPLIVDLFIESILNIAKNESVQIGCKGKILLEQEKQTGDLKVAVEIGEKESLFAPATLLVIEGKLVE